MPAGAVSLVPHRAVYDMKLERTGNGTAISDVNGRLVYEIIGSACEGYAVNTRIVTELVLDGQGSLISDLRSVTFESGNGEDYRFISSTHFNNQMADETNGTASRGADGIDVTLVKPKEDSATLPEGVMFPTQHLVRLIKAAEAGDRMLIADLYDGAESGKKVYATTAAIGTPLTAENLDDGAPGTDTLDGSSRWPMTIAYFDTEDSESGQGGTPVYELSLELYANGVSRNVLLDYGDFALRGTLASLEVQDATVCE